MTNFSIGGLVLLVLYKGGQLVAQGELTGGQLMAYMVSIQGAQKALCKWLYAHPISHGRSLVWSSSQGIRSGTSYFWVYPTACLDSHSGWVHSSLYSGQDWVQECYLCCTVLYWHCSIRHDLIKLFLMDSIWSFPRDPLWLFVAALEVEKALLVSSLNGFMILCKDKCS